MREIKFKGLIESAYEYGVKQMVYYGISTKPIILGKDRWIVEDLQFTGLKDKNGKEIWEGDVVVEDRHDGPKVGFVEFQEGLFSVNYYGGRPIHQMGDIEVIGNRWENPDLIHN